jgi:predicted RNA-binding Zn ribbon-like protein
MEKVKEQRSINTLSIDGGILCLNFINTVSDRTIEDPFEYFSSYPLVLEWSEKLELLSATQAKHLHTLARKHVVESAKSWIRTLEVREMLLRNFRKVIHNETPDPKDLQLFNRWLSRSLNKLSMEFHGDTAVQSWNIPADDFDQHIYMVMHSAFDLLTSTNKNRIKACGPCGWLFLDGSKNNSRKWCNMEICGSHVKSRAYYQRNKARSRS